MESALKIPERNSARRKSSLIVEGILMNDLALAFKTNSAEESDIDRVASTFVIHVLEDYVEVFALRIDLCSRGDIVGLVHGKVPACGAIGFIGIGEAGAVGMFV